MMKPTYFVDFEASGIAPDSYPIEVAVVSPGSLFVSLIEPAPYWNHWCYDAQDMHGLSRETIIARGTSPLDIAQSLNEMFDGQTLCSDSPADSFWLDTLYEAAGIDATFHLLPLESFVGRKAADDIIKLMPPKKTHRALPDARALAKAVDDYFKKL